MATGRSTGQRRGHLPFSPRAHTRSRYGPSTLPVREGSLNELARSRGGIGAAFSRGRIKAPPSQLVSAGCRTRLVARPAAPHAIAVPINGSTGGQLRPHRPWIPSTPPRRPSGTAPHTAADLPAPLEYWPAMYGQSRRRTLAKSQGAGPNRCGPPLLCRAEQWPGRGASAHRAANRRRSGNNRALPHDVPGEARGATR